MPLHVEVLWPMLVLAVELSLLGKTACLLARTWRPRGGPVLLFGLGLFWAFLSWIPTLWGFLGIFHPLAHASTAVLLYLGARRFVGVPGGEAADEGPGGAEAPPSGEGARAPLPMVFGLLVLCLVGLALFQALILPPFGGDTRLYHLPKVLGPWQDGSWFCRRVPAWYYPASGESLQLWSLCLFRDDFLVNLATVPAWLFFLVVVWSLGRRSGEEEGGRSEGRRSGAAAGTATALILASPVFMWQLGIGKNDVAWAAWILFACVEILRSAEPSVEPSVEASDGGDGEGERALSSRWVFFALGQAVAVKYAALPYAALLLLWQWKRTTRAAFWAGLPWGIFALPWYLRNLWLSGNPVFPLGSAGEGPGAFLGTSLLAALAKGGAFLAAGQGVLLGGGLALALLPAACLLAWRSGRGRERMRLLLAFAFLFLVTPYSGRALPGHVLMGAGGSSMRLGLPFLAIAAVMIATRRTTGMSTLLHLLSMLGLLPLLFQRGEFALQNLGSFRPALVASGLSMLLVLRIWKGRGRRRVLAAVALAVVLAMGGARLHALRQTIRPLVMRRFLAPPGSSRPSLALDCLEALDPSSGAAIEVTGLSTLDWYGPSFRRRVHYPDDLALSPQDWMASLEEGGISFVILSAGADVVPPRLAAVSRERLRALLRSPRHACRFSDGRIWIFRTPALVRPSSDG